MQLLGITLIPVGQDPTPLTPDSLRDRLIDGRVATDRVEHVKVIERSGTMWVGAYLSITDIEFARQSLRQLCDRVLGTIDGWEIGPEV